MDLIAELKRVNGCMESLRQMKDTAHSPPRSAATTGTPATASTYHSTDSIHPAQSPSNVRSSALLKYPPHAISVTSASHVTSQVPSQSLIDSNASPSTRHKRDNNLAKKCHQSSTNASSGNGLQHSAETRQNEHRLTGASLERQGKRFVESDSVCKPEEANGVSALTKETSPASSQRRERNGSESDHGQHDGVEAKTLAPFLEQVLSCCYCCCRRRFDFQSQNMELKSLHSKLRLC